MNSDNLGAFIEFDDKGNIVIVNVIANSDTGTDLVRQKLKPITRPSAWTRLKRLLSRGQYEQQP